MVDISVNKGMKRNDLGFFQTRTPSCFRLSHHGFSMFSTQAFPVNLENSGRITEDALPQRWTEDANGSVQAIELTEIVQLL